MGIYEEIVEELKSWDVIVTPGSIAARCNDYIENLKSLIGNPIPEYIEDLTNQSQEEDRETLKQEILKQIDKYENFLKDYNIVENIDTSNGICFICKFNDEYFWWQISRDNWNDYWSPKKGPIVYLKTEIDKREAIVFVNDSVNKGLGYTRGSFKTAIDTLNNYWND